MIKEINIKYNVEEVKLVDILKDEIAAIRTEKEEIDKKNNQLLTDVLHPLGKQILSALNETIGLDIWKQCSGHYFSKPKVEPNKKSFHTNMVTMEFGFSTYYRNSTTEEHTILVALEYEKYTIPNSSVVVDKILERDPFIYYRKCEGSGHNETSTWEMIEVENCINEINSKLHSAYRKYISANS